MIKIEYLSIIDSFFTINMQTFILSMIEINYKTFLKIQEIQ